MNGVGSSQDLDTLVINGSVISKERTGTSWSYGVYRWNGYWQHLSQDSGFDTRINSYERVQAFDPPPFAPSSSEIPYLTNWREQ